jgi:hypothetical protein
MKTLGFELANVIFIYIDFYETTSKLYLKVKNNCFQNYFILLKITLLFLYNREPG